MGYQDRHYHQDGRGPTFGRLQGGSVVIWLLGINCVVFLIDAMLSGGTRVGATAYLSLWGNFNVVQAVEGFQVWRFVTYQFLHGGFGHILFNMIGLYFFGPMMEQWWGSKRFLAFYLLCGVCGALPMIALGYAGVIPVQVGLVGASGALYGILIGAAALFPNQRVQLLIPPIPMSLRTMAIFFLGISLFAALIGNNDGGNAAHLAGAALGFFLVKKPGLLSWADRLSAQAIQDGYTQGRYEKKIKKEQTTREEVDRILAKVSEQGLQSLSKREKKILQQDTDRLNQ
ncbi:MAG: rhomboid family intramembrane serine protease [Planctomycetota bacterium]